MKLGECYFHNIYYDKEKIANTFLHNFIIMKKK